MYLQAFLTFTHFIVRWFNFFLRSAQEELIIKSDILQLFAFTMNWILYLHLTKRYLNVANLLSAIRIKWKEYQ